MKININAPVRAVLTLVAGLALTACGGGSGNGGTEFRSFVSDQFDATSDQTDPVAINGRDFRNRLDNNPNAYDELLARELGPTD